VVIRGDGIIDAELASAERLGSVCSGDRSSTIQAGIANSCMRCWTSDLSAELDGTLEGRSPVSVTPVDDVGTVGQFWLSEAEAVTGAVTSIVAGGSWG
jgi:hypothetical protein